MLLSCNPKAAKSGHLNRADAWFLCHPKWDQEMWSRVQKFGILLFCSPGLRLFDQKYSYIVKYYCSIFFYMCLFVCDFSDEISLESSCHSQSHFITAPPLNLTSLLHLFTKHNEMHTFHFTEWFDHHCTASFFSFVFLGKHKVSGCMCEKAFG